MYDTIRMWLPVDNAGDHYHNYLLETLESPEQKLKDECLSTAGYLNNLKVGCYLNGISISGSIAKYYLNDNFNTLTRSSTQKAIEMLSDQLKMNVCEAEIKRIDVATNFLMNNEPEVYYPLLGQSQYYSKVKYPHSVYYSNMNRTKLFYNKVIEGKKKGCNLPELWKGRSVLRYEMRYKKGINKQFNSNVLASSLYDESFYMKLLDKWQEEYYNINKSKKITMNYKAIETPKDFMDQLILKCIDQYGMDTLMEEVETLQKLKIFKHRRYYNNLKDMLKKIAETPGQTEEHELIEELDQKISRISKHYR